jgi:hypothetical protein
MAGKLLENRCLDKSAGSVAALFVALFQPECLRRRKPLAAG